jgi:hypothetical protein
MKKFYLLCKLVIIFLPALAQNSVEIVTGTAGSPAYNAGPIYRSSATSSYDASRYSYLYTQDELAAAGITTGSIITELGWVKNNSATTNGGGIFRIYMKNSAVTEFSGASETWTNLNSGASMVYENTNQTIPSTVAPDYIMFTLNSPFTYTGGSIEISTEWDITQVSGSPTTAAFDWLWSTVANRIYGTGNTTLAPITTLSSTSNSISSIDDRRPFLKIVYNSGSACTDPVTPGQAVSSAPASGVCEGSPVALSLTGNTVATNQIYKWQSAPSEFGTYSDVSGELSTAAFSVTPSVTTWYKAVVKCGASGTPQSSAAVQVVVNPALPAGTYTINNTLATGGTNFQSFTDAINRMNCGITGSVIFDVAAGQTFSESPEIKIEGTASATITFRKAGAGANPVISKAGTSATTDYLVKLTGADYVIFDGIDLLQTGSSTADFVEYGLYIVNASATNGSQHNVFKNGTISLGYVATSARCVFMDDVVTPTDASGTNSFNKFLNMKVQNAFTGYYITGASATYPDVNNQITTDAGGASQILNLGNGSSTGTIYGVYGTYQSGFSVTNTEYSNFAGGGTSAIYGSYFATSAANSITFSNNHVHDLIGGGTVYGFYMTAGISLSLTNNHFHAIRSNTATSSAVRGLDVAGSTGFEATIANNRLYDISSAGLTTTTVAGIETAGGANYLIQNNMISDLRAPASTSTSGGVKGLSLTTTTAGSVLKVYYNTIYLNDAASASAYSTAGIYKSSATPVLDLRNNLVLVTSDVSAGTRAVAFWNANATLNLDADTDNNLYYTGVPGPKNLIYYDGTNSIEQLNDYKLMVGMAPREENSLTENTALQTVTTGIVRINPNTPSLAESGGQVITGITTDFEGTPRGPYPLGGQANGAGTKPDIGADEYDGRTTDVLGPTIHYDLLANTSSTSNRTLVVTITDPSGVRTGANGPRLYYRKTGSTLYAIDNNPVIRGNEYTFIFDYAAIGGVTGGDLIEYYVAAQDLNGYASTSPFGGSGANPPGLNAPSAPVSYLILQSLNGVYTVGATGSRANLTAIANLLKNGTAEVTGHTVFELQADYDGTTGETFPIEFTEFMSSDPGWTVTIRPAAGVTARVTSGDPGSANPVINLNGIDRLTFDGRPGGTGTTSEWTIRNTRAASTIGAVMRLINDATNDTLRYLTLESQATATTYAAVHFSTSASGTQGNSFNLVANNTLRGRTDVTPTTIYTGIYSSGTTAVPNTNNSIVDNHIVNVSNYGIYLAGNSNGQGWTISGNHIYGDITTSATKYCIYLTSDNTTNLQVINNFIGGSGANATGLMTVDGNVNITGIYLTGSNARVAGNTIGNITNTNTGTSVRVRGIYSTSDVDGVEITGNTVFNLSSYGSLTGLGAGSQTVAGISVYPSTTWFITNVTDNVVYNISAENPDPLTTSNMAAGLFLTNFRGVVARNKIYNITNKSTGTTAGQPPIAAGIYSRFLDEGYVVNNMIAVGQNQTSNVQYNGIMVNANGANNKHYYYFNTVFVGGTSNGDISSFGFVRGDNSATSQIQDVDVKNNIFYMLRSGGTAANYAIASQGTTPGTEWMTNYNNLYNTDNTKVGLWDATSYDLAGWQAISSQDANSRSIPVNFVNPLVADFHLTGGSVGDVRLGGVVLAQVTTDFDLQARNSIRPYMGADEGAIGLPVYVEYFRGERQNNVHLLSWKGHCTGNNNLFAVERSADGRNFSMIGEIPASQADCSTPFNLIDKNPLAGVNYYRLRTRDENGRVSYSITIAILNKSTGFEVVSVFPTPTKNLLYVNVSSTHKANLQLAVVDVQGRIMRRVDKAVQPGTGLMSFDVTGLAAGVYVLQCRTDEGYEKTIRFVKQ